MHPQYIIGKGNSKELQQIARQLACIEIKLIIKYGRQAFFDARGSE
jgi:hypothetical protein